MTNSILFKEIGEKEREETCFQVIPFLNETAIQAITRLSLSCIESKGSRNIAPQRPQRRKSVKTKPIVNK